MKTIDYRAIASKYCRTEEHGKLLIDVQLYEEAIKECVRQAIPIILRHAADKSSNLKSDQYSQTIVYNMIMDLESELIKYFNLKQ